MTKVSIYQHTIWIQTKPYLKNDYFLSLQCRAKPPNSGSELHRILPSWSLAQKKIKFLAVKISTQKSTFTSPLFVYIFTLSFGSHVNQTCTHTNMHTHILCMQLASEQSKRVHLMSSITLARPNSFNLKFDNPHYNFEAVHFFTSSLHNNLECFILVLLAVIFQHY